MIERPKRSLEYEPPMEWVSGDEQLFGPHEDRETRASAGGWTPGPWDVGTGFDRSGKEMRAMRSMVYRRDGVRVADCNCFFTPWEEQEANARLIAVAPELFEALQTVPLPGPEDCSPTFWRKYREWRDRARAVLSKAASSQPHAAAEGGP